MKFPSKLILSIGILSLLLIAGCVSTPPSTPGPNPDDDPVVPASGWLAYAPVQANTNPWQIINAPFNAEKSELEQVKDWLSTLHVGAVQYGFIPHDEIVCDALNCPRGDYLIIHPQNTQDEQTLRTNGFFSFNEVGVWVDASENTPGSFSITIVNALNEPIYYGGCNDFILEKINADSSTSPIIPKTCVWEGLPSTLNKGMSQTFEWMASQDGEYRVVFGYGTNCDSTKPLNSTTCGGTRVIHSLSFSVTGVSKVEFVKMYYGLKQCNTNPWQNPENSTDHATDELLFSEWLGSNGITPSLIQYIPAPEGMAVCLACSCAQGDKYVIVISLPERVEAEALGFTYGGLYTPALSPPAYAEAQWFVTTPYQCFANKWNPKKQPVHSVETDLQLMEDWLEENGVDVTYLTFIRGVSLSQQCTKLSTDKYGVGVLDDESAQLLSALGLIPAGNIQLGLFTDTTDIQPLTLVYKSKFCTIPPWGDVEFKIGNEAETSEAVAQWLANQGMELFEGPTIHQIAPSFSGSCDTDSGLAVKVTIPAWSKPHVLAYGFQEPSYSFEQQQEQVYPPLPLTPTVADQNA